MAFDCRTPSGVEWWTLPGDPAMTTRALFAASGAALVLLLLAGCGVTSDHPLSDEKTSVVDDGLIGRWRAVKEDADGKEADQILVGRRRGTKNTLEAVGLELDGDEHVQVRRFYLYATTIGDRRYLSATGEKDGQAYMFLRYAMPKKDTLHVYLMNAKFVGQAIEKGELEGKVEKKETEGGVQASYETVHITADTAKLRAWIEKHQDECFAIEDPAVLRKLESQGSDSP
jgi:hypothetical protein